MKYAVVDRCPVPAKLAPVVKECLKASGATLNSAYRGKDAEHILNKYGKSSQSQLYQGWIQKRPGFNPANPPGYSTHELRSDGVAYNVPRGMPLRYWMCGLDIGGAGARAFIDAARRRNWVVTLTYPSNPYELHHVNFRKRPFLFRPIKKGQRRPAVRKLTKRLKFIKGPNGKRYFTRKPRAMFDSHVRQAVVAFQKDHSLVPDGVVGPQTKAQIDVVFRNQWKKRKG